MDGLPRERNSRGVVGWGPSSALCVQPGGRRGRRGRRVAHLVAGRTRFALVDMFHPAPTPTPRRLEPFPTDIAANRAIARTARSRPQSRATELTLQLFQLPETAYVREVVFVDPDTPSATCMSMNLNLAQYV